MTDQQPTKEANRTLDDPFYARIRRDLGPEKEQALAEAIEAIQHDRKVLLQIVVAGILALALSILLAFGGILWSLAGIALIVITSLLLLSLIMTWISIRPPREGAGAFFGQKTLKPANPHSRWLKARVRHGFRKAVIAQTATNLAIVVPALILVVVLNS